LPLVPALIDPDEGVPSGDPVQFVLLKRAHVMVAWVVPAPTVLTLTLPSVKVVVALPDVPPLAMTVYVAMNHSGRLNWRLKLPSSSATTSASWRQV
jgi:hypothetical protein